MRSILAALLLGIVATLFLQSEAMAETCTQAKNACERNCRTGYSGPNARPENRCSGDCGNRFTICLQTGTWTQTRREFQPRHGLTKQ